MEHNTHMITFQQARDAVTKEFAIDTLKEGLQDSSDYVVMNAETVIDDVQYWVSRETGAPRIELGYETIGRTAAMRRVSSSA